MAFDQPNGLAYRAGYIILPQAACLIDPGYVGFWIDIATPTVLRRRNADGTDSIVTTEAQAGPVRPAASSVGASATNPIRWFNNVTHAWETSDGVNWYDFEGDIT